MHWARERARSSRIEFAVNDGGRHGRAVLARTDRKRFEVERIVHAELAGNAGVLRQRDSIEDRRDRIAFQGTSRRPVTDSDLFGGQQLEDRLRSEEHTSELHSLMRLTYDVFCLKKKKN